MTESEITALIGYVNQRWPHAPLDANAFPVWVEDLAEPADRGVRRRGPRVRSGWGAVPADVRVGLLGGGSPQPGGGPVVR
jgi:hypothetical protein